MAKDTEKLIRQLSLISYLMAERRPVTAQEIRRDVEGYSAMNEDAFARRFYADRSELEALRIFLSVEKPVDGLVEQETYSLAPENFHLPAIEFTDKELAGAPHRAAPARRRVRLRRAAAARAPADLVGPPEPAQLARAAHGRARDHRLRRRTRAEPATGQGRDRDLPPQDDRVRLLHDGARRAGHAQGRPLPAAVPGRPVLSGRAFARAQGAIRVFRLSRIRGKVGYATKAEHDFQRPAGFDPRAYANRIDWQFGDPVGHRRGVDRAPDRLADRAPLRPLRRDAPGRGRRRPRLRDPVRQRAAADRLGPRPRRERAHHRPARARRRAPRPGGAAGRAPHRRAADRRRRAELDATRRTGPRARPRASARRRQRPSPRRRDPPRAVRAPGDAGEHPDRRPAAPAGSSTPRSCAPRSRSQSRSCARTSRCSTWSTSARAHTSCTPSSAPTG